MIIGEAVDFDDKGEVSKHLREAARLVNEGLGEDLGSSIERLHKAQELFHEAVAIRFAPVLNQEISRLPKGTLEEKRAVCRIVNDSLRALGLAIRCPKTEQPAMLFANHGADQGRFQITLIAPDGNPSRTVSTINLPELKLRPHLYRDTVRMQGGWVDEVQRRTSRKGSAKSEEADKSRGTLDAGGR